MPYVITREPAFLRIRFSGVVTDADIHLFAHELLAIDASAATVSNRLVDFSPVTEPQLTYAGVRALVERRTMQPLANPVKTAMVAPRPILYGFARMFQTLNEHPQLVTEIFSTQEEAEAWLLRPIA